MGCLEMSAEIKNVLQYYIRYEDYSRFLSSSLSSVIGDHLPNSALNKLNVIKDTLGKKQKKAILEKVKS